MAAAAHDELVTLLEEALINTKHVQSAAIVRRRDGQTRARTRGFPKVTRDELDYISYAFKDHQKARENTVSIAGRRFRCVRADATAIYLKEGDTGVIITQTSTNWLLAVYTGDMAAPVCVEATEMLGRPDVFP